MKIGTIQKFSLIDYPGKVSAVVGTQGCNMRCFWCHNHYLIPYDYSPLSRPIEEDDFFRFLKDRINFLDAIVISGGEPTIHVDLPGFCEKIKSLGYLIKLDTNGTNPRLLRELIASDLLDYVAMDIKTHAGNYDKLCREKIDVNDILSSIDTILSGDKPYEFRTTCVTPFVCRDNIDQVAGMITGARLFYLQRCTDQGNMRGKNGYRALDRRELTDLKCKAASYVKLCRIR
jgi:pyruvate formate lyase activating enzyme